MRAQGAEEANSPLAVLIDPAKLDRDFMVTEAGEQDGLEWLHADARTGRRCQLPNPRASASMPTACRTMQVIDALGQRTEIGFSGWKRNPAFATGTFRYTPPKGVDVVDAG